MAPVTLYARGNSIGAMTYDWRKTKKCVKKENRCEEGFVESCSSSQRIIYFKKVKLPCFIARQ